MLAVHAQALAEQDLIDIWLYTFAQWGEAQADKYHNQLSAAFTLIAENPDIGSACDEIRENYRKFHVNRHLIMYRVNQKTLHIIRVLGDDMNYIKHLDNS